MKTNKNCSLILMLLCFTIQLHAQKTYKLGLNFGGQQISVRGFENGPKYDFQENIMVGINAELGLSDNFSVVTNINYNRATKSNDIITFNNQFEESGRTTYKQKYDFINTPFLLKWHFGTKKNIFVNGGAFVNYFIGATKDDILDELSYDFEKIDYGASFGVGFSFLLNNQSDLTLEFRNDYGLSNAATLDYAGEIGEIKTNTMRLILTYNISAKKKD